ncbi:conserved protein of unknown function [[Clostridium] ultunense Esp]|uniref:Uncharacterized protein n=1 Tax=[Clostridium] ultunense Esp TaxID=1288971 RepID=A0A1M4PT75_9FIRM|nr:conserved protein of unknown function [[Clostridium] ultunense Esp]
MLQITFNFALTIIKVRLEIVKGKMNAILLSFDNVKDVHFKNI